MKGYLTHLIRRQKGETFMIRPRLPSRFEHAADVEQSALPQFFDADWPTAQIQPTFSAKDRAAPRELNGSLTAKAGTLRVPEQRGPAGNDGDAKVTQLPPARMLVPTIGAVQAGAPQDPEMAISTVHEHSASQANVAAHEAPQLPRARVAEPSSVKNLSASKVRTSQSGIPSEATCHAALQSDASPRRNQTMAATERPLIRVSIGRIDVRADLSKAAPPKSESSARVPQPQPLADYLKGRGAA